MKAYFKKENIISFSKKVLTSPFFWILILTIFLLRTILFTSGIPHHGDLTYPSTITQYQKALFPLWNESTSVSNLESIDRGFSLLLVLMVRLVGGEVDLLAKLYFFIPLFVSGITTAYLVRFSLQKIRPNKTPNALAIIIAAFIYMISPWVLEQVQAPFFWLSYAVTPGIILLAYRFFLERRLAFGIGLAILWTVASTTPHYTLFSFLIILFIWICSYVKINFGDFKNLKTNLKSLHPNLLFFIKVDWGVKKYLKDLRLWAVLVVSFIALNAYWIVVTAFLLSNGSVTPGYAFTSNMLRMFSGNEWLGNILTGTDQWISWWPGQYSEIIKGLVISASIALPAILIIALGLARKAKGDLRLIYILIGIWIIGIFFALGGNNPVYSWLATGAPFSSSYGWLLRVPGKISYLLWPAYAVCAGLVVQSAYSYCSSKKTLRKKALVITTLIVLLISSTGYAVLKSDDYFNYYYAPVPVPNDYQQAFSYIGNNLTNVRVADLARYENGTNLGENSVAHEGSESSPGDGGNELNHTSNFLLNYHRTFETSYTWNPHRIAGYFVPRSISTPSIGNYHFTYSSTWEPAYSNFQENITRTLWYPWAWEDQSGVYNVSLSRLENINVTAVSWFPVYGVNYILYHNDIFSTIGYAQHDLQVLNGTGCQLVQQWGDIYLFNVPQTFGRIYALDSSWNQSRPPTAEDVNASGVNIYDITQVDATHWELNLNATEPFSLIFTEGFDSFWAATVKSDNGSLVYTSQIAFGSINSFLINQTGELHVSIQYRPQTWLYYGITVSILLLIAIIVALSYFVLRRKIISK